MRTFPRLINPIIFLILFSLLGQNKLFAADGRDRNRELAPVVLAFTPAEAALLHFEEISALSQRIDARYGRISTLSTVTGGILYLGGIAGLIVGLRKLYLNCRMTGSFHPYLAQVPWHYQQVGFVLVNMFGIPQVIDIGSKIHSAIYRQVSHMFTRSDVKKLSQIMLLASSHADQMCGAFGMKASYQKSEVNVGLMELTPKYFRSGLVYMDGKQLSEADYTRLKRENHLFPVLRSLRCGDETRRSVAVEKLIRAEAQVLP